MLADFSKALGLYSACVVGRVPLSLQLISVCIYGTIDPVQPLFSTAVHYHSRENHSSS
jgi:hypothetical protein